MNDRYIDTKTRENLSGASPREREIERDNNKDKRGLAIPLRNEVEKKTSTARLHLLHAFSLSLHILIRNFVLFGP